MVCSWEKIRLSGTWLAHSPSTLFSTANFSMLTFKLPMICSSVSGSWEKLSRRVRIISLQRSASPTGVLSWQDGAREPRIWGQISESVTAFASLNMEYLHNYRNWWGDYPNIFYLTRVFSSTPQSILHNILMLSPQSFIYGQTDFQDFHLRTYETGLAYQCFADRPRLTLVPFYGGGMMNASAPLRGFLTLFSVSFSGARRPSDSNFSDLLSISHAGMCKPDMQKEYQLMEVAS